MNVFMVPYRLFYRAELQRGLERVTRFELANYDLEGHFHHHYGPTRCED